MENEEGGGGEDQDHGEVVLLALTLLHRLLSPEHSSLTSSVRPKIVRELKIGKVDPTFHTDPWLCRSLSLSRLMVLYIWRLSTERIVNGTITEKLTPGHNETGQ